MAGTTTTVDDIVDKRSLYIKNKDNEKERATSGHVFRIFLTLVASELIAYKDLVKKAWRRLGTGLVKDWRRPGGGLGYTGKDRQRPAEPGAEWNGLVTTYRDLEDSITHVDTGPKRVGLGLLPRDHGTRLHQRKEQRQR